ncbi:hypothetical protein [Paraburkholderia caribensis]|uniref:hypothetical protein n=1 Tax=Paraburkholderia caribensis TaxID=75105 RepID=UPI001CAFC03E|nr:hypothetical protein [Paraburkholderia caribensis]CAG9255851.1 conserved hypothetical protein [Paraburkholderia caribensis]
MYVEIESALAKITSVTPISEKHGKKRVPAHSIIFEMAMSNTILIPLDSQLRTSFYQKPKSASVDPKSKQTKLDVSNVDDGLSQLKFSWWSQWIDIPGELVGWVLTFHTGNTERSHIVLEDAKVSAFAVLPKDLGITLLKCKAIVHPSAHEKGKIDELLQTEVKISIMPPDSAVQGDMIGHPPREDDEPEEDDDVDGPTQETEQSAAAAASSDAPIEDPFAGTDLARGVVKSDAKVTTKKPRGRRSAAPADKHADGAWPFPKH